MILAGLRSLDSVSGSRYYGQLMEKIQAGSSEFVNGRDSILIDLSSWYRDTLPRRLDSSRMPLNCSGGSDSITIHQEAIRKGRSSLII